MVRFGRRGRAPRYRAAHARGLRRLEPQRRVGRRPAARGRRHGSSRRTRRGSSATSRPDAPRGCSGRRRDAARWTRLRTRSAPVFRAEPSAGPRGRGDVGRRRSRGRAPSVAPKAFGVTLRLWLDPDGPGHRPRLLLPGSVSRRATLSPARRPSRDAGPAGGVPPRGGGPVRARLRARRDPNPCTRCNGGFRFAELLAFAGAQAPSGSHRPLRPYRRARRWAAGRPRRRPGEGPELHARGARPKAARPRLLPARRADQSRGAAKPRVPGLPRPANARARKRASSRATTTARSSGATARRGKARSWTRPGTSSADAAFGAPRPANGGHRCLRSRPSTCSAPAARHAVVVGPRGRSLARTSPHAAALPRGGTGGAKLRYRSPAVPAPSSRRITASGSSSASRRTASRAGQAAVLYEADAVVGAG